MRMALDRILITIVYSFFFSFFLSTVSNFKKNELLRRIRMFAKNGFPEPKLCSTLQIQQNRDGIVWTIVCHAHCFVWAFSGENIEIVAICPFVWMIPFHFAFFQEFVAKFVFRANFKCFVHLHVLCLCIFHIFAVSKETCCLIVYIWVNGLFFF